MSIDIQMCGVLVNAMQNRASSELKRANRLKTVDFFAILSDLADILELAVVVVCLCTAASNSVIFLVIN